jgi:hypothetical protein
MNQKPKARKGFWGTIPGRITKIVGIVVAVIGFVASVIEIWRLISEYEFGCSPPPKYIIESSSIKVLPYYMKNFLKFQRDLYWYKIRVENKSDELLHLDISFQVIKGPAVAQVEPSSYTVYPKQEFIKNVDPGFEFTMDDVDGYLRVRSRIRDVKDNILYQCTDDIEVIRSNIMDWSLKTPKGKPVDRDFLVASLAAWTLNKEQAIIDLSNRIRSEIDMNDEPDTIINQWFSKCYKDVFHGECGVRVTQILNNFPMPGRQKIKTPAQVLDELNVDPLEALLLLAAISYNNDALIKLGPKLVMFVSPGPDRNLSFLLSWTWEYSDWTAIDLSKADATDFESNRDSASKLIESILREKPGLRSSLRGRGVFIDERDKTLALDFGVAAMHYNIKARKK